MYVKLPSADSVTKTSLPKTLMPQIKKLNYSTTDITVCVSNEEWKILRTTYCLSKIFCTKFHIACSAREDAFIALNIDPLSQHFEKPDLVPSSGDINICTTMILLTNNRVDFITCENFFSKRRGSVAKVRVPRQQMLLKIMSC